MKKLKSHYKILVHDNIRLRPMNESDWDLLLKWNNDKEVLYYSEGDDIERYSLEDIQGLYRSVSQNAYCFIIEYDSDPIGECWLQKMNLKRIINKFPDCDCRRIDIMIGEKEFWGRGIGTKTLKMLLEFGFESEQADIIFYCDVADYNPRSVKAALKAGFEVYEINKQPEGQKAEFCYDLIFKKERYFKLKEQAILGN